MKRLWALLGTSGAFLVAAVFLALSSEPATAQDVCAMPGTDVARYDAFIKAGCHKVWEQDPVVRETGPVLNGVDNSVHGYVKVYYSPAIMTWLRAGRVGTAPDGAMLVKEQYSRSAGRVDTVIGWTSMLRDSTASADGWFWFQSFLGYPAGGQFGDSGCLRCHASAVPGGTFASLRNLELPAETFPVEGAYQWYYGIVASPVNVPGPNAGPSADLARLYGVATGTPQALPQRVYDHVPAGPNGPQGFVTSDQCIGCHNAYDLPNMQAKLADGRWLNVSPYGEWSASLMGLAGRDPVFHAQLEWEKQLRPTIASAIDNTCYRCHGVTGLREAKQDGLQFSHEMIYATSGPNAKYGALAREGITCTSCHRISGDGLGTEETYTGQFNTVPANELVGPFADPKGYSMKQALGVTVKGAGYMRDSALCGSCHVVELPRTPNDFTAGNPFTDPDLAIDHEQTTYFEWRNSAYQNETAPIGPNAATCQDCHMPSSVDTQKLRPRIANIEEPYYPKTANLAPDGAITLPERDGYARHTLVGINLFVMKMFQQFQPWLGLADAGDAATQAKNNISLGLAEQSATDLAINKTARVQILGQQRTGTSLETTVRVTNLAGHKFPSGVGFRRAILEFTIVDAAGTVAWSSGQTDSLGVIVGPDGNALDTEFANTTWQPHYELIERQDNVQIYEERSPDSSGKLTTSFLSLYPSVKDNRLLPLGWKNGTDIDQVAGPEWTYDDPRYRDGSGSDDITYRVPLDAIPAGATIQVRLKYQSIPPYYIAERVQTDGPESRRLLAIVSRLNLSGSAAANWVVPVASASAPIGR